MIVTLKALVVILFIAYATFTVAKPICSRYMTLDDFVRRRNLWFALTLIAFLSPSFWLFVIAAIAILLLFGPAERNPAALYVILIFIIPPSINHQLPVVGINALFEMEVTRILAFGILVPYVWRLMMSSGKFGKLTRIDVLVLAFGALQILLLMPYETITHSMRRTVLLGIDVLVLYFAVSRCCRSRKAIVETLACFCLMSALMAALAVFEAGSGWLLYQSIGDNWDSPIPFAYILRGDFLRAQVSAGHALVLGNIIGFGFISWLYFCRGLSSRLVAIVGGAWLLLGLLASSSRGPMLATVVMSLASLALVPNQFHRFIKVVVILGVAGGLVIVSPIGDQVVDKLPFVGTFEGETVSYREQLLLAALELILENPLFGTPYVLMFLESLRQGQGIIDLVNTHARIAMFYGLVGWALFVGPFLLSIGAAYRILKTSANIDPDLSLLGITLIACLIGLLLMMGMGGYSDRLAYLMLGLATCYAQLGNAKQVEAELAAGSPIPRSTRLRGS